jgi:hypothetical protein
LKCSITLTWEAVQSSLTKHDHKKTDLEQEEDKVADSEAEIDEEADTAEDAETILDEIKDGKRIVVPQIKNRETLSLYFFASR